MCGSTCVQTQHETQGERCVVCLISRPVGACQLFLGRWEGCQGRDGGGGWRVIAVGKWKMKHERRKTQSVCVCVY